VSLSKEELERLSEIAENLRQGKLTPVGDATFLIVLVKTLSVKYEGAVKAFTEYVRTNDPKANP
jgi:hypothetical protein